MVVEGIYYNSAVSQLMPKLFLPESWDTVALLVASKDGKIEVRSPGFGHLIRLKSCMCSIRLSNNCHLDYLETLFKTILLTR